MLQCFSQRLGFLQDARLARAVLHSKKCGADQVELFHACRPATRPSYSALLAEKVECKVAVRSCNMNLPPNKLALNMRTNMSAAGLRYSHTAELLGAGAGSPSC